MFQLTRDEQLLIVAILLSLLLGAGVKFLRPRNAPACEEKMQKERGLSSPRFTPKAG